MDEWAAIQKMATHGHVDLATVVLDKTGPITPRSSGQYCKWPSATRPLE